VDLIEVSSQTKRYALLARVLLDVGGKVNRLAIFDKDFTELTFSHVIDLFQKACHIEVLEFTRDHLRCEVRLIKDPLVIDTYWHNLYIIFKVHHFELCLHKHLNRHFRIFWEAEFAASDPFVVLE